ncbi:type IV pilus modification protein PilV [Acinetobacter sp. VNH17]|uniref:Type IV pilus modification protein PilV n=1 Tax=Acinetobacter thutiue TaxID=2998078 RepID=A0ABT7WP85_9GAMM|nr:type IV pilus modification protein PilV [Acinetobacter thutiue]MCY6412393.1 type IV pilus modification protein PilV [Acinetobacter thutiue]MDN0014497.1 type IV pilus modification protein PilV [Acinetobacter thutiue]
MRFYQQGVGLVEVLVALIILAIAVLGFTALQIRALAASQEAGRNIQAINIARDLSERIRVNREALLDYKTPETLTNCATTLCTAKQMAGYDFQTVSDKASDLGMQMAVLDCQGSTALERKCIYVSWEGTTPTNGVANTNCTNGVAYLPDAKCIIVEVYNYDKS